MPKGYEIQARLCPYSEGEKIKAILPPDHFLSFLSEVGVVAPKGSFQVDPVLYPLCPPLDCYTENAKQLSYPIFGIATCKRVFKNKACVLDLPIGYFIARLL